MRILGPDGQPIGGGSGGILGPNGQPLSEPDTSAVSEEVKEIIARSKEIAAQGDPQSALQQMVFAFQTDVTSDLVLNTVLDLLRQSAQSQGAQQSDELQLFEQLRDNRDKPEAYFAVGYRFFQLQQMFLARPFLAHAREMLGDQVSELSQGVDMHLAQACMDQGDYEEAISVFHAMNDKYGGLPIWLLLSMAECYALLGQIDEAEAVFQIAPPEAAAQFEGLEEVREEVGDMLARVRDYDEDDEKGLRAWHYVQSRGMLVETNPDENVPGERFVFFQPSEEDVAYVCGVTAALLDSRGYAPTKLLWLGENSEPLARIFSQWWEISEENIRPYEPADNTDDEEELSLLVMAHSYDVLSLPDEQAFFDLAQARAGLITFALDLRWTERQPLTPDVAGFMAQVCHLPWETRFQVAEDQTVTQIDETRDALTIATEVAAQFPSEEDCDQFAKELLDEYAGCTDLIIDHRDGSLNRRPLALHSPIKSPRFGF